MKTGKTKIDAKDAKLWLAKGACVWCLSQQTPNPQGTNFTWFVQLATIWPAHAQFLRLNFRLISSSFRNWQFWRLFSNFPNLFWLEEKQVTFNRISVFYKTFDADTSWVVLAEPLGRVWGLLWLQTTLKTSCQNSDFFVIVGDDRPVNAFLTKCQNSPATAVFSWQQSY